LPLISCNKWCRSQSQYYHHMLSPVPMPHHAYSTKVHECLPLTACACAI
jgi:hypothetical protein